MSDLYLITVTADQLRALKWAAAYCETMHEQIIPESERNIALFTARSEPHHADVARQNVANARLHLADIRAASPALYDAKPFPSPAPTSSSADHDATAADLPLSGSGMTPPVQGNTGGSLEGGSCEAEFEAGDSDIW